MSQRGSVWRAKPPRASCSARRASGRCRSALRTTSTTSLPRSLAISYWVARRFRTGKAPYARWNKSTGLPSVPADWFSKSSYARREKQALVRQPVAPLLRLSADLLRAALPAGVSITVTIEATDLDILADATQLNQVILNLGTNAWHAMKGRPGRIDVRLLPVDDEGQSDGLPTRQAVIEIEDNGVGMDAETLAQAFDPYFTTKAIGHGTGLGLSVVWGIVKAHGGTITVESVLGQGTVFRLRFPVLGNEGDLVRQIVLPSLQLVNPAGSGTPHGANRMVLVVDDDDVVLLMLEGVLRRAEFRVLAFSVAQQAIDAVRADPFAFDAVVTDMNMPEISGLRLARAVALIRKDLPVILGSGFVSEELAAEGLTAGVAGVYRKEQSAEMLPQLLCDVMDARQPGRAVLPAYSPQPH
jgi:CheY-like chemotaxis protein